MQVNALGSAGAWLSHRLMQQSLIILNVSSLCHCLMKVNSLSPLRHSVCDCHSSSRSFSKHQARLSLAQAGVQCTLSVTRILTFTLTYTLSHSTSSSQAMSAEDAGTQLLDLPDALLKQVLLHVPWSHRLGACSSVCSRLMCAAEEATTSISLDISSQTKFDSLCSWLPLHGQHVVEINVTTPFGHRATLVSHIPSTKLGPCTWRIVLCRCHHVLATLVC